MIFSLFFVEKLANLINLFFPILFSFLKYTLVIILISIGFIFLLNSRGIHFKEKIYELNHNKDHLNKTRLILGLIYILIGLGIMFNYLIYLLIWIFKPFKGFISILVDNFVIDSDIINQFIYPFVALGSFIAILQYFLSLFYFINNKYIINKPSKSSYLLFFSILEIIFFGFECFPFLLT